MTPDEIERELSLDMNRRRHAKQALVETKAMFQPDDDRPAFYVDYSDDSPREKARWLADQLSRVKINQAVACLFDTRGEAKRCEVFVEDAVALLGWKHSKRNPGFYTEVLPVNGKSKLRIKRLR